MVTNVVSALTPSIAAAVEQALAAQAAAEAARVEAERRAAEAEAARLEAERRAAAEAAAAAAAAAASSSNSQVKYNFEYKVAEDEDQVYITQNEARDGDELQGESWLEAFFTFGPQAPIPLWIPAVPWSLSTMKQGQWAIPRSERRSSGSLRSGRSPPGLLQLLLK